MHLIIIALAAFLAFGTSHVSPQAATLRPGMIAPRGPAPAVMTPAPNDGLGGQPSR